MDTHTLRKLAAAIGAGLVLAAPLLVRLAPPEAQPHLQEVIAGLGALLAWFGHAPDHPKPQAPAEGTQEGQG